MLTALVAISISHALTNWRLYQTQLQESWLEAHRNKSWPDPSSELYMSSTVIGELFYGALNSNKIADNIHRLLDFVRDAVSVVRW